MRNPHTVDLAAIAIILENTAAVLVLTSEARVTALNKIISEAQELLSDEESASTKGGG